MFRIGRIDWGSRFEALERVVGAPRRALNQIGAIMAQRSRTGFDDQGRDQRWPERAVPNIPGILRDYHMGKSKPPARRFQSRPALKDEGTLEKAVNFQVYEKRVEIGVHGPAKEYVDIHQFGGETETEPVTPGFKKWLTRWLNTSDGRPWTRPLVWLLYDSVEGPIQWNVMARPIFVLTPQDVADVAEMTGVEIVNEMQEGA